MNITAVMATLDLWDLDHSAKHALLVIACRADRAGVASVSIPRAAADMQASYNTARAALDRVVKAGYLTVDKWPGQTSTWHLTPSITRGVPRQLAKGTPSTIDGDPINWQRDKDSLDKTKEREFARPANRDAGDNPARGVYDHLPNWTAERLNGNRQP